MINYPRSDKTGLGRLIPSWKLLLGTVLTLVVIPLMYFVAYRRTHDPHSSLH